MLYDVVTQMVYTPWPNAPSDHCLVNTLIKPLWRRSSKLGLAQLTLVHEVIGTACSSLRKPMKFFSWAISTITFLSRSSSPFELLLVYFFFVCCCFIYPREVQCFFASLVHFSHSLSAFFFRVRLACGKTCLISHF